MCYETLRAARMFQNFLNTQLSRSFTNGVCGVVLFIAPSFSAELCQSRVHIAAKGQYD